MGKIEDKADSLWMRFAFRVKDHPKTTLILAAAIVAVIVLAVL